MNKIPLVDSFCRICRGTLSKNASYRFANDPSQLNKNGQTLSTIVRIQLLEIKNAHHCKTCYCRITAIQKAEADLVAKKESLRREFLDSTAFFQEKPGPTALKRA